jgi:hypothetical protein
VFVLRICWHVLLQNVVALLNLLEQMSDVKTPVELLDTFFVHVLALHAIYFLAGTLAETEEGSDEVEDWLENNVHQSYLDWLVAVTGSLFVISDNNSFSEVLSHDVGLEVLGANEATEYAQYKEQTDVKSPDFSEYIQKVLSPDHVLSLRVFKFDLHFEVVFGPFHCHLILVAVFGEPNFLEAVGEWVREAFRKIKLLLAGVIMPEQELPQQ